MPYVRTVKTGPGATAVQVVWSSRRGSGSIQHIGSAHDEAELEVLKAAARQRMAVGQLELGLGMARGRPGRYRSRLRGWASCWTPSSMATACWGSGGRPTATRSSCSWYCAVHRADEQAGLAAGSGGGRGGVGRVRDGQAAAASLPGGVVAAQAVGHLRRSRRARPGQPGPLRCLHALLRDRRRRRVPRTRVLQGAAAGAADHHRAAHRAGRVPAHGLRLATPARAVRRDHPPRPSDRSKSRSQDPHVQPSIWDNPR